MLSFVQYLIEKAPPPTDPNGPAKSSQAYVDYLNKKSWADAHSEVSSDYDAAGEPEEKWQDFKIDLRHGQSTPRAQKEKGKVQLHRAIKAYSTARTKTDVKNAGDLERGAVRRIDKALNHKDRAEPDM